MPFEEDVKVDERTLALNYDKAQYVISAYDRNAIEAAVQLAEKHGGCVSALSVSASEKLLSSRKDVLSRGAADLTVVVDEKLADADSLVIANTLAGAICKIGGADIIFCAEGSSDVYAQQTGPRLAQALGMPVVTSAVSVEINGNTARVIRKLEDGSETIDCPLPMVITVAGDSNNPRIPSFKQIMGAGKKPFAVMKTADLSMDDSKLAPAVIPLKTRGNAPERKKIVIEDEASAAVAELVRLLVQDGNI